MVFTWVKCPTVKTRTRTAARTRHPPDQLVLALSIVRSSRAACGLYYHPSIQGEHKGEILLSEEGEIYICRRGKILWHVDLADVYTRAKFEIVKFWVQITSRVLAKDYVLGR